jgi:hypothetical protein
MTNYLASQQVNIDGFLNATQNQIKIVRTNGTVNKIENPSFEMPVYDPPTGTMRQWNWDYTKIGGTGVYPVTFEHAFSGSYAWKIRMNDNSTTIRYGVDRLIQPVQRFGNQRIFRDEGYQEILSFYYYGVVDATTTSYNVTDYGAIIGAKDGTFVVRIYGSNNSNGSGSVLIDSKPFTVNSLPKSDPGDLDNGVSGSMNPHFYKWERFTWVLPQSVRNYKYCYFAIQRNNVTAEAGYDFYLVVDAFQWETQPEGTLQTMYFDGSFDGFNTQSYPMSFQWTGPPHKSMSIRSQETRSNGELVGIADYCNFYVKSISGMETKPEDTKLFTKTLLDGQHFVEQISKSRQISISGRIIADNQAQFIESFARFQELLGKKPFAQPEPVRMFFELSFTNGISMVPLFLDVVYMSGLELDTSNVFQSDIELNLAVISDGLMYQNDSSSNMFNDRPLYDQFNTMQVDSLRDVAGFFYYNKSEEIWESPSNIGFFAHTDNNFESSLGYNYDFVSGVQQIYEAKDSFTTANIYCVKEDKDGIIWVGGRFDVVEIDGFYVSGSEKKTVKLRIHCNNIVGLRKRAMSGEAFVYPDAVSVSYPENGPNLTTVTYNTDWQIIPLLDIPTRYSMSNEFNPPFIGLQGASTVFAIEITPDGTMYIGGDFKFNYGTRRFNNMLAFVPFGPDAQNVNLYIPQHSYSFVSVNLSPGQLLNSLGRGRFRTEWVNSAIPYCKYGMFTEVGSVGPADGSGTSAVHDIKYDYLNECLYVGGNFTLVSNAFSLYNSIQVGRFAKFNPSTKTFVGLGTTAWGVDYDDLTVSNDNIVRKILVEYTADGVKVYLVGKFSKIGQTSSNQLNTSVASFFIATNSNSAQISPDLGGAKLGTNNAEMYDIVQTKDQRIYVSGNFDRVNTRITPETRVRCIAELRNNFFVDITRGLEANNSKDYYQIEPVVRSMSVDSEGNIFFVGAFSNIRNRFSVDGIAKWDGVEFSGTGISFRPRLPKILQTIYTDESDNMYVFSGPNTRTIAITRTLYNNIDTTTRPTSIDVAWTNLSYSDLKNVFGQDELNLEFLCIQYENSVTYSSGFVHTAVRLDSSIAVGLPTYASRDIIFIGGRFDYVRMGDTYFRVNNLVAFEYDAQSSPFPYRVITFSSGTMNYYDRIGSGTSSPNHGIKCEGSTEAVFSIDVKVSNIGGVYIPTDLFVGGRFDFTTKNVRYKNFVHMELQKNTGNTWIQYNIPANVEARLSVPYMNYATWHTPGLCGVSGTLDAVYAVKVSSGTFLDSQTRTNPNIVIIGGDFIQVTSNNAVVAARRVAVYTIGTGWHTSLTVAKRFYKIDFTLGTTARGVEAANASFNANIYVKSIQYVPWYRANASTFNTHAIVMGRWPYTNPFLCGATSVTSGNPIVRIGIGIDATLSNRVPEASSVTSTFTGSPAPYFTSSDYDYGLNIYVVGRLTVGARANFHKITGAYAAATITVAAVATANWPNVYQSNTGLPYVPLHVYQSKTSTKTIYVTGAESNPGNLFADATVVKYPSFNYIQAANYAYANVNLPQVVTTLNDGSNFQIAEVQRRYRQAKSRNVGYPMAIPTASQVAGTDNRYTMSIPTHAYVNTLYDANIMQTFNCYNNGTLSVYPTISLYSPFSGNIDIDSTLHVITNVTTKQSLYLALTLQPGELIRIRTQKERISVISNINGDITNAILSTRNVMRMKIDNAQIFRLVPGKNVIRYGPTYPLQRYFRGSAATADTTYNSNENVVVPPIIITFDWQMSFNSVHDALYTHTNPLLLR